MLKFWWTVDIAGSELFAFFLLGYAYVLCSRWIELNWLVHQIWIWMFFSHLVQCIAVDDLVLISFSNNTLILENELNLAVCVDSFKSNIHLTNHESGINSEHLHAASTSRVRNTWNHQGEYLQDSTTFICISKIDTRGCTYHHAISFGYENRIWCVKSVPRSCFEHVPILSVSK